MSIVKIRNFRELITDCPDFFFRKGKWIIEGSPCAIAETLTILSAICGAFPDGPGP